MAYQPQLSYEPGSKTTIFAVRTTIGQEKSVLQNIFNRLRVLNPFPNLKCILPLLQIDAVDEHIELLLEYA